MVGVTGGKQGGLPPRPYRRASYFYSVVYKNDTLQSVHVKWLTAKIFNQTS